MKKGILTNTHAWPFNLQKSPIKIQTSIRFYYLKCLTKFKIETHSLLCLFVFLQTMSQIFLCICQTKGKKENQVCSWFKQCRVSQFQFKTTITRIVLPLYSIPMLEKMKK